MCTSILARDLTVCQYHMSCVKRKGVFNGKCISFKGGNSVKIVLPPFRKGSTLKGKNLLPLGANSFLLE